MLQPAGVAQVAISRANLDQIQQTPIFSFSKFGPAWIYQLSTPNAKKTPNLNRVTSFCILVTTKSFNPEKYGALCKILVDAYNTHGTPVKVLDLWLSAIRGASIDDYDPTSYTKSQVMLATSIKGTLIAYTSDRIDPSNFLTAFLCLTSLSLDMSLLKISFNCDRCD